MKVLTVIPGKPESVLVEDREIPPGPADGLLVEGLAVGVCGTDTEIVRSGYGWTPPDSDRLVLFHESLGRVLEAPASSGFEPDDLVAGIVRRPDPVPCACCGQGQWDFCRNGRYTERGIKELDGYGASRWRIEPEFAVRLDPALGDLGVLTEPTSVVAKAWDQIERIGGRACVAARIVLVTGAGPIGLLAAMIGVQAGYEVHVLDVVTDGPKPRLVRELGARYHASGLADLDLEPDIVVECTGVGELVFDVITKTGPNAVTCLTGLSSGTRSVPTRLDALNSQIVLDNDVVFGSVNANRRHYELAARALHAADPAWLSRLITRRVSADHWTEALDKQPDDVKVVVDLRV